MAKLQSDVEFIFDWFWRISGTFFVTDLILQFTQNNLEKLTLDQLALLAEVNNHMKAEKLRAEGKLDQMTVCVLAMDKTKIQEEIQRRLPKWEKKAGLYTNGDYQVKYDHIMFFADKLRVNQKDCGVLTLQKKENANETISNSQVTAWFNRLSPTLKVVFLKYVECISSIAKNDQQKNIAHRSWIGFSRLASNKSIQQQCLNKINWQNL